MIGPCLCGDPHCPRCFPSGNPDDDVGNFDVEIVREPQVTVVRITGPESQASVYIRRIPEGPTGFSHKYHVWGGLDPQGMRYVSEKSAHLYAECLIGAWIVNQLTKGEE